MKSNNIEIKSEENNERDISKDTNYNYLDNNYNEEVENKKYNNKNQI